MTEKRYNDFDLEIRSLLQDAEEEVPPQAWEAISARVQHRRRNGAWIRWAAAAAAAIAAVMVLSRPSSVPSSAQSEMLADNVIATVPESPAEEGGTVEDSTAPEKKPVTVHSVKRNVEKKVEVTATEQAIEETEKEMGNAVEDKNEAEGMTSSDQAGTAPLGNTVEKKKSTTSPDPFALMAYEDAHKDSRRFEFDVKGIVGTNDNTASVAGGRRMTSNGVRTSKAYATIIEDGESVYGVPVTVGAGVKMHFAPKWAVSAGLDYTLMWRTFKGSFTSTDSRQFYSDNIKHSVRYVGLPVNLYHDIVSADVVNMYAFAGGTMEKGLEDKYVIPGPSGTQTWKQDIPGFQWSAAAGLGVQFKLWNHMGLYADPGLRYYFDCNQPKSIRTQQPLMFSLELGLRFDL